MENSDESGYEASIFGSGWENVAGVYGNAQEEFFKSGVGSAREILLADSPNYVFNEYLQCAIAFGIPIVCLALLIIILCIINAKKSGQNGIFGALIGFMIVAFASYPLQFIEFKVVFVIYVLLSVLCNSASKYKKMLLFIAFFEGTAIMYLTPHVDVNGLLEQAKRYADRGEYINSNHILRQIVDRTSHSEPLMMIGKNYENLCIRDSAEKYFYRALNRVPNRLKPHYFLMNLYKNAPEDSMKCIQQAKILLEKEPKVPSIDALEMKQEALYEIYGTTSMFNIRDFSNEKNNK